MLKKKIPTLVGMLLLLVGAAAGVLFLDQDSSFLPRAAPEYIPQKVKITNISDSGFTISWITEELTIGFVKLGIEPDDLDTTIVDERDQLTGSSQEYRSHYITVQDLSPSNTYYFKLGSHGKQLYDNDGQAFSITTGPTISSPPSSKTAYGSVFTPAQTPAQGAIVYLNFSGSTPLSALTKQNGNWAANLSLARSADFNSYTQYDPDNTTLEILVQSDSGQTAQITTTTSNTQPVDNIIIGENNTSSAPSTNQPPSQTPGTDTQPPQSKFSLKAIEATEPLEESSIIIDTVPDNSVILNQAQLQFSGSAPPGANLTITIHSSQVYTDNIAVDSNGTWNWVPPGNLEPGEHTISLSYADTQGILHNLTRTFVVQAAEIDNPPQYSATPSATLAPTRTPSPTPVPSTPAPTTAPTPTIPIRSSIPSTSSAIPISGTTLPTYGLAILGILFLLSGIYYWQRPSSHSYE